jgi:NAD(P)-dependent dehydrogenase (short-subunit alcohol dehydrogenase family)
VGTATTEYMPREQAFEENDQRNGYDHRGIVTPREQAFEENDQRNGYDHRGIVTPREQALMEGMMDLGLTDKVALITGTGSQIGFGRGIALFLAREGCHIISVDMDLDGAKKTAADVTALGRTAIACRVDITQKSEIDEAVKKALSEFGRIDILVNCAGRATGIKPFTATTPDLWDIDIDTNLKGTMRFIHAVLPHMLERKYGKIVNFSTHAADQPTGLPGAAPYVAAKAAVAMLTKNLSGEYGPEGININVIAPGPGATNFHRGSGAPEMAGFVDHLAEIGKAVLPEDIAYAVGFLVSDVSSKIVGQVIEVSAPLPRNR